MKNPVQTRQELDAFYATADPWDYDVTADDALRKSRLLSLLPRQDYATTIDVGCGNGFLTVDLPGKHVIGLDLSQKAVEYAADRARERADAERFTFKVGSILELNEALDPDSVDLFLITGVLYPQYIGDAFSVIRLAVDRILKKDGILVSCHIDKWCRWRFPYTLLDQSYYPYREFDHRLEIMKK